jgi:epoxyqueuosine reductase
MSLQEQQLDIHACVATLGRVLAPAGLDRIGVATVGHCNALLPAGWKLPDLGSPQHAVIVIGHGRGVWAPFVRACRAEPRLRADPHPFDRWTAERILAALREALPAGIACELRHVWEGPPRQVAMQAVAVAVGLGARGPAGLVVDTEVGPWMAFRAVVIVAMAGPEIVNTSASPCATCVDKPCVAALETAQRMQHAATSVPPGATRDGAHAARVVPAWRAWLGVREACPVGGGARYSEAQIRYHYARDRSALDHEG